MIAGRGVAIRWPHAVPVPTKRNKTQTKPQHHQQCATITESTRQLTPHSKTMTTSTCTLAEATRLNLQKLGTTPGLPSLPHIPESLEVKLTPEQQEANLLHVALWIVERDGGNFDMGQWHQAWGSVLTRAIHDKKITGKEAFNECGTVHCIAGFAQVMAGEVGFSELPATAGYYLLGEEAESHFFDSYGRGLGFLKKVIARNS